MRTHLWLPLLLLAALGGCQLVGYDAELRGSGVDEDDVPPLSDGAAEDSSGADGAMALLPQDAQADGASSILDVPDGNVVERDASPDGLDASAPDAKVEPSIDAGDGSAGDGGHDGGDVADSGDGGQHDDAGSGGEGEDGGGVVDGGTSSDAGDAGDAADASTSCPNGSNGCGGCGNLVNEPGAACGTCGLGRYVCDGKNTVACVGGDALPVGPGGIVLIDNFEDGDGLIRSTNGLNGVWYTTSDGTSGVLNPPPGSDLVPAFEGAAGSARSARITGRGFSGWGAALAAKLNTNGCNYNASAQAGLAFYAKGSGTVVLTVATRQTLPPAQGGTCTGTCFDHFAVAFPLTPQWAYRVIPWSTFSQMGWGTPVFFFPSQLRHIQFAFTGSNPFELSLDNLSFY